MINNRLFRYSGNKTRYIHFYKSPPLNTKRIVEPYLGAGAYLLAHPIYPALGYDINDRIVTLWHYLKSTTPERLQKLQSFIDTIKPRTDLRSLTGLSPGEIIYIKINICSLVVGQLSSWVLYNDKFKLPIDQTIALLPRLASVDVIKGDCQLYNERLDDLVFLDPPYFETSGNYKTSTGGKDLSHQYNPSSTEKLISRIKSPIIFTYGNSAPETFPKYKWEIVAERKVPNMKRKGASAKRIEYVSYINWPTNKF